MTSAPTVGRPSTKLDALAHGWRVSTPIALAHDFLDAEWVPRDGLLFVGGHLVPIHVRTMDDATEAAARTHVERDVAHDIAEAYQRNEAEARARAQRDRVARGEVSVTDRASLYLSRMDATVAGSGTTQNAMWRAAVAMVRGFDLSPDAAFDLLMREWNPRCDPPRHHREIARAVRNASRASVAAGYLLEAPRR